MHVPSDGVAVCFGCGLFLLFSLLRSSALSLFSARLTEMCGLLFGFLFSCHFRDAAYIILRLLVVVSLILLFSFSLSLSLAIFLLSLSSAFSFFLFLFLSSSRFTGIVSGRVGFG